MAERLHPNVVKFKSFAQGHPELLKNVRAGKETWAHYYERYKALGEEDHYWLQFKDKGANSEPEKKDDSKLTDKLLGMLGKIDFENLDKHIDQADQAVSQLKNLMEHFSEIRGTKRSKNNNNMKRPNF
ncbi:Putative coat protein [Amphibacillus marinus]|uniref:Putative coat protein n=1 Tax=Amphibacillus marinus TaxID=872970 RepID=A0A1H8I7U2_9BACI|nr:spore coat protein YlbD [Amphibacillus marinus]SEN64277.1 Putative coat protein [Amphibacillus marinus]